MRVAYWDCPPSSSRFMLPLMRGSSAPCTWLAVTCLCPAISHQAVGAWCCWRIQSTTFGLAFLLLCITRAPLWERLDLNSSSSVQVVDFFWVQLTCSAEPSLPPIHVRLVQTSDLRLHWMLLTIAAADCCGGSLKPACSWGRSVLPGALVQLLHDKTVLEIFNVIVVVVLVWKCFGMHNLKARECGLEEIITCSCSLWKCALWPQQKYCNQKYCLGQLTFSLSFKGKKNCIALQWLIFLSEISSRFKSLEIQGVWGAQVVNSWPPHLWCSVSRSAAVGMCSALLSKGNWFN